jgi:hypothetical protein
MSWVTSRFENLFFPKSRHAMLAARVAHIGRNAEPFKHLDPGPRYRIDFAAWSLFVYIMEDFGLGITYVPLAKIWRVQSSCQFFRRSKIQFRVLEYLKLQ